MLSLLRLECRQKKSPNSFRIRIFLFLSYSSGIETINTFIGTLPQFTQKPYPDKNGQSAYPFSEQNDAKTDFKSSLL